MRIRAAASTLGRLGRISWHVYTLHLLRYNELCHCLGKSYIISCSGSRVANCIRTRIEWTPLLVLCAHKLLKGSTVESILTIPNSPIMAIFSVAAFVVQVDAELETCIQLANLGGY